MYSPVDHRILNRDKWLGNVASRVWEYGYVVNFSSISKIRRLLV